MAKENKGTLMYIWNLPYIFVFIKKWHPENFDTQKPTRKENIHYIYRFFLNKNQTKFKHKGGDFLVVRWSEIMHFNVSGFGKVQKQQQQKKTWRKSEIGNTFLVRIWKCVFLSTEIGNFLSNRRNSRNTVSTLHI